MAYRFLNPAPVFFNVPGTDPIPGGSLTFYTVGTTTPKNTWSDQAKTILNPNPVPLDSSGRSNVSIWLDGEYKVVLKDNLGATVWTRDVSSGVAAGLTIPALAPGYLTNDGSNLLWSNITLIPDPTGSADYVLSTDGTTIFWIPKQSLPDPPDPVVVIGTNLTYFAQGSKAFAAQSGTASAPNVGGRSTTATVVYPTTFQAVAGAPLITPTGSVYSPNGNQPSWTLTSTSTTGFTVKFTMGELDDSNSGWNFNAPVPFGWITFGTITTPT